MTKTQYDVAIIGGGPAGSTSASYLAKAGVDCVLFEAEVFPREHVGESLVPATTPVLAEIGALEKVDSFGFPRKYGAAWTSGLSEPVDNMGFQGLVHDFRAADVLFNERTQEGVHQDYTYHVDRGEFDRLLLEHAEGLGAEVRQGVRVTKVDMGGERPRVTYRDGDATGSIDVELVIDASGRDTFLGKQERFKNPDPVFNQFAIHSWFDHFDRRALAIDPEQIDFIFIHFLPVENTWVWQIPITETITSVGVVTQKRNLTLFDGDKDEFFWHTVESRPELAEALRASDQVRRLKTEGDYSYSMSQICGDRFVLVGDAARFVDPIFSSGVSVAMNSARLACKDAIEGLKAGDLRKERFRNFESKLRRGVQNWYEFITLYYRLNILFTAFVQDPRYRIDVLRLLQGDVYDLDEPAVLQAMRDIVREVESDPDHLWHKHLGTLEAPTAAPAF